LGGSINTIDGDALSAQQLFPEFRFKTFAGKSYITDLEIPVIPVYLKIDSQRIIEEAADLADNSVLQIKIP
jgi:hypothetical protein